MSSTEDLMSHLSALSAFQRAPSLEISKWYRGNLVTNLAEARETDGAYCLMEAVLKPGNEPPPHVHSREDELFYVIEGSFDVYVGDEVFPVGQGGCVFLPRLTAHAFIIRSPRLKMLTLFTPGGLECAFGKESLPAQSLEVPAEAATYSTGAIEETVRRLNEYGVHILSPEEVASELPRYPRTRPDLGRRP
jgi:mannose-6-phosphate isomerase-like protein (cupin superfamily)